jgi:aspartate kinase
MHTVEKIGGTSMSDYQSVKDNIILAKPKQLYNRIFVVSAYAGITNALLNHKKNQAPGVYSLFAAKTQSDSWQEKLLEVEQLMTAINQELFSDQQSLDEANLFIGNRIRKAKKCLTDLKNLCIHGHFAVDKHLETTKEMLASLGEAHSAWNLAKLLQDEGINAVFVDLTAWDDDEHLSLDQRITKSFKNIDITNSLAIATGYAHSDYGLMSTFDRGYSEMTFSRIAVMTDAKEAIIHKEFHLSSADPRLVGENHAVPIGRTNYDIADQLASLGMEAIHPKAAKGLRSKGIDLRVKNTFEPEHDGTLITADYLSATPCVEIIAGCTDSYVVELFDQDLTDALLENEIAVLNLLKKHDAIIISKDINANTITHYIRADKQEIEDIHQALKQSYPESSLSIRKVAIISVLGSDMKVPGILASSVSALSSANISVLALHQAIRQIDIQFIIDECDYEKAVKVLHQALVEIHEHGQAICLAS